MRDAFGGTMMIEIMMIFIVLIVAFTAVLINVAKTFRIKNEVVNIIEQTQYNGTDTSAIDEYIRNVGYQTVKSDKLENECRSVDGKWGDKGYCIAPIGSSSSSDNADYYKVTVYVSVSFPFFDLSFTLPISGETKSYHDLS